MDFGSWQKAMVIAKAVVMIVTISLWQNEQRWLNAKALHHPMPQEQPG